MHKIFSFLRKTPSEATSPLEAIEKDMTQSRLNQKPIYTNITEEQKTLIKESFAKISKLTEKEKSALLSIAKLVRTDLSNETDPNLLEIKNISYVALLDKGAPGRLESANKQMSKLLLTTAKALYYEESIKNTPDLIEEIPATFLEKIQSLPPPKVLGWKKSGEKEIVVYEFLDKIYKGPEDLKEGIRAWIIHGLSQFSDQEAKAPGKNLATLSPSYSTKSKEEHHSIETPFISSQNHTELTKDLFAIELVKKINDNPESQFHTSRDPCCANEPNSFPVGNRVISLFSPKLLNIHIELEDLVTTLEGTETFPDGSPYSGLQLVKIIDDIYNIARKNVNALIQQKERELSSLYKMLNPNNEETQTKLFLGYMQSDAVMIQLKDALKQTANQDSALQALLEKLNKLIGTIPNSDLEALNLTSLNNFRNVFDFFTEFHLLGALSSPKFELWPPHLGEQKKSIQSPCPEKESFALTNPQQRGTNIECLFLPGILFFNDDREPHIPFPSKTRFFPAKEVLLKDPISNSVNEKNKYSEDLQEMANRKPESGDSSTPSDLSDQPNVATEETPDSPTGDLDALNTSSLKERAEIAVRSESSFSDPTALLLVDNINNNSRPQFFKVRDAASQDSCNLFPAGFQIVDDYKRQQGDISEDLYNIIATLEDPEIFPDGSPYSGLQLVKIIDDIYNIARKNVNALIQQKERELSSLYKMLNPNNEETRTKLFLGYMQSDAVMSQLKDALKHTANQDSALKALLEKLNEFIEFIRATPDLKEFPFNSLGDFKNLFDFFTKFHLLGALSSPKLKLWPEHLGQETASYLPPTGLTPEFKALNKLDSKGRVEYPILPTILYLNEKGENLSFAGNLSSTTYFFHA